MGVMENREHSADTDDTNDTDGTESTGAAGRTEAALAATETRRSGTRGLPVTVLGLGAMGQVLASTLLAGGCQVTVWNRTAAKAAPLAAAGALPAATPAEALAAGGPVIVCVLDYASVTETLADTDVSGRTIINLSNGTPGEARQLAADLSARGAEYLDGGIMATPPLVGTEHAFLLYSGPKRTLDSNRALLELLGSARYAGEDPGMAALQDVALLSAMYGLFSGMTHAFALTRSAGVAAQDFAVPLTAWLTAMASLAPEFAGQIDSGDYVTGVSSTLEMQLAAYGNLLTTAEEQGISAELITPMHKLMEEAVADGAGPADLMVALSYLSAPAGSRRTGR